MKKVLLLVLFGVLFWAQPLSTEMRIKDDWRFKTHSMRDWRFQDGEVVPAVIKLLPIRK